MSVVMEEEITRWTARRKSALVLEIIQGRFSGSYCLMYSINGVISYFLATGRWGRLMFARIKAKLGGLVFALRNIQLARKIVDIKNEEVGDLLFRGYSASDAKAISEIYQELNDGAVFSRIQRELYSRVGRRCMLVVEQREPFGASKIVGMNMYYLNKRDVQENTIHEGFIGVVPEASGRGIATQMRQIAIRHFKSAGLSGISTRISLNSVASLMSARKIGFQAVEEYQEPSTGEQRYYMVCKF